MEAERRLVLDANILIRAVLGPRARSIFFENAERTTLFAPEIAYELPSTEVGRWVERLQHLFGQVELLDRR